MSEYKGVKCSRCNDIIISKSVHDFVTCTCGAVSVDGGMDYLRIVGNAGDFEILIEGEDSGTP